VATVLANRGISARKEAVRYLNPVMTYCYNTRNIKDAEKAAKIIAKAISKKVKIAIYGDYDADGVMSITILYKTLKNAGADVFYYVPKREEEGYGLNRQAVEHFAAEGVKLIITCDNGIAAFPEIERAKELSMAVIVIDHHEPAFIEEGGVRVPKTPDANAIIDPKQTDCRYPFKNLCAAGLSYKFVKYFCTEYHISFDDDEFLVLAAIATICDIVDLVDENRIIAKNGLKRLNEGICKNLGLRKLIELRKLKYGDIDECIVGFIIGPCINAAGRLAHAEIAVNLFTTDDELRAESLAAEIIALNESRKEMSERAFELACTEAEKFSDDKVLVLFIPEIHESIIGVVAGKLKEKYSKPTIMITKSGDTAKGSARSIEAYNIFEEMYAHNDLYLRFGGHAMAAGFSILEENIPVLRQRINATCRLTENELTKKLYADMIIPLNDVTFELTQELELCEPFGRKNEEPTFISEGVYTEQISILGTNRKTLKFIFLTDSRRKIKAVAFNRFDDFLALLKSSYSEKVIESFVNGIIKKLTVKLDIAYHTEINEYNGISSVQLKIIDFKLSAEEEECEND
ncbi:MAG: single-stranded-DNA-specific exonuclease RecJ, partial [Clostridiales bacterium]|nr:single-stranded-DNA-specific exonuclease RecJ [Clostridiales bacterium]